MRKILISIIIAFTIIPITMANDADTLMVNGIPMEMPESMTAHVDSMLKKWYSKHYLTFSEEDCQTIKNHSTTFEGLEDFSKMH